MRIVARASRPLRGRLSDASWRHCPGRKSRCVIKRGSGALRAECVGQKVRPVFVPITAANSVKHLLGYFRVALLEGWTDVREVARAWVAMESDAADGGRGRLWKTLRVSHERAHNHLGEHCVFSTSRLEKTASFPHSPQRLLLLLIEYRYWNEAGSRHLGALTDAASLLSPLPLSPSSQPFFSALFLSALLPSPLPLSPSSQPSSSQPSSSRPSSPSSSRLLCSARLVRFGGGL